MNCLLLGGAPNVGKTGTIKRLVDYLITTKKFKIVIQQQHYNSRRIPIDDYMCILEGQNKENENIRIIINTATDIQKLIKDFKTFYDINSGTGNNYDILVSSVRDIGFIRNFFFSTMKLSTPDDFLLEIPCGKVREGFMRATALSWYNDQMDNLINHTLENIPFNI